MKKVIFIILAIIISFILGVFVMGYLSKKASLTFLEIVKFNYKIEQQILAVRAKQEGNFHKAAIYYTNIISVEEFPGLMCFNQTMNSWSFDFPFSTIFLQKMSEARLNRGVDITIGITHGRFAEILEFLGRNQEAQKEYQKAAKLMGVPGNINRVKEIIKKLEKSESELLKLQDKFTYQKKS